MAMARTNRATLIALSIAALVFAVAMIAHARGANDTEIVAVPLNPEDPSQTRIGQLEYRGGLDIPPMGQNIGGLSGLRWDADSGRLLAITDDARWVWMTPVEEDQQLTGISAFEVGPLLGLDGEALTGKEQGDSESLTRNRRNEGWIVGFERDHRAWIYADLSGLPEPSTLDLSDFGPLEDNAGLEAMASTQRLQMGCVERLPAQDRPNCVWSLFGEGGFPPTPFMAEAPSQIAGLGGVPTDADATSDQTALILFRSYSRANGNGAAIVAYEPSGARRELLTLRPPFTVDNFEGLAVREEEGKTFLYIVSDDNFSSNQRTLLMKFEVLPQAAAPEG